MFSKWQISEEQFHVSSFGFDETVEEIKVEKSKLFILLFESRAHLVHDTQITH